MFIKNFKRCMCKIQMLPVPPSCILSAQILTSLCVCELSFRSRPLRSTARCARCLCVWRQVEPWTAWTDSHHWSEPSLCCLGLQTEGEDKLIRSAEGKQPPDPAAPPPPPVMNEHGGENPHLRGTQILSVETPNE